MRSVPPRPPLLAAAIGLLGALALGCAAFQGKPVPDEQKEMVGVWKGVGVDLTITADGGLDYRRTGGSGSRSINSPVQAWAPDGFDAGIGGLTTHFAVQAPPHLDGDTWKMTVDGAELVRVLP